MRKAWPYVIAFASGFLGLWIGLLLAAEELAAASEGRERGFLSRVVIAMFADGNEGLVYGIYGSAGAMVGLFVGSIPLIVVRVNQSMRLREEASRKSREKLLDALTLQEATKPRST